MKVLITGAGGQVGWELQQTVPIDIEITALHRVELDIADQAAVMSVIKEFQPDLLKGQRAVSDVKDPENGELIVKKGRMFTKRALKRMIDIGIKEIAVQEETILDKAFAYTVTDPKTGETVTDINIKSIITQPEPEAVLPVGNVTILGAAYAGEADIEKVEVSTDGGESWQTATFIGPHEPYAWRQWQYVWQIDRPGSYRILSRATDGNGEQQPMQASWNKLGYNNNGVLEHGVSVQID